METKIDELINNEAIDLWKEKWEDVQKAIEELAKELQLTVDDLYNNYFGPFGLVDRPAKRKVARPIYLSRFAVYRYYSVPSPPIYETRRRFVPC